MRKKELTAMPLLKVTPYMKRMAMEDVPKTEIRYGRTYKEYKRGGYTRCCIKDGILKLAIFYTEPMRMGATMPKYEMYFDKKKQEYITYDRENEKWLTSTYYNLSSPNYLYYCAEKLHFSRETKKAVSRYFDNGNKGIGAIRVFQNQILADRLKAKHKRETDPWDEDLKQTPDLPKDWDAWVSKVGVPEHYIFYTYSKNKKGQTGYCSHCGRDVPIKEPRYNKEGFCPKCRARITYKAIGKCGCVETRHFTAHLIQRCEDGVMLREFSVKRIHRRYEHKNPYVYAHELRRVICNKSGVPMRAYYYATYKQTSPRWIGGCLASVSRGYFSNYYDGRVYGKTMPSLLNNELQRTGIWEYYKRKGTVEPERFLRALGEKPYLEKIAKVGLSTLFDEQAYRYYYGEDDIKIDTSQTSLTKMLGVNAQQLKRMRACNSGRQIWLWLRYEKTSGHAISDKVMGWLCSNKLTPKDFKFIREKMSMEQIYNYVNRQMRETDMDLKEVLNTWSDYLSMARRLNLDTDDAIIYRVRKLKQRHDELVEICNEKADAIRAGEILELFPNIEKVMAGLKSKYAFSDDKYTVIVPDKIEDILLEGRTLHHCVSDDKYWERIATNESYVMFLRKTESPDKAYYTLEVEPCGTVRQKRTMYDRQNEDIEEARAFIRKWQKEIRDRMSGKDRKLAQKSKVLRLAEFAQMDKDNVLINTGLLQGQRLVDVLMADLMEVAA